MIYRSGGFCFGAVADLFLKGAPRIYNQKMLEI
jgi:hypothetical protein